MGNKWNYDKEIGELQTKYPELSVKDCLELILKNEEISVLEKIGEYLENISTDGITMLEKKPIHTL